MLRNLMIAAALSTAPFVGLASPAAAQTYGGITLSFGSGGYGGYDYDGDAYDQEGYYGYGSPWGGGSYSYVDPDYAWRAHERQEQAERWQQDQAARRYWQNERQEYRHEHDDDDDDN